MTSTETPGAHRGGGLRQAGRLLAQFSIVLLCGGFGPPVLTDGGRSPLRLGPDQVAQLVSSASPPQVMAASALVFDLDAQQTVFELRPDDALPPASTAKIMTALLVLQHALLDESITVSARAAGAEGSRMGLAAGERLTVMDLLYGLLLPSGNDAAVALAEHVAGSEEAFVRLMNEQAAELGMSATRFVNSAGLDEDGQLTSARDLVALVRSLVGYPVFWRIVAAPGATVGERILKNTNDLLTSFPGADGIKTGTTDAAGECLVASMSRNGHRMVAVILGSSDRYADARKLLEFAADGWRWGPIDLPQDALAWEIDRVGDLHRLRSAASFDIFLPAWQWSLLRPVRRLDASVPLTSTLSVGELTWLLGEQTVASAPLAVLQGP